MLTKLSVDPSWSAMWSITLVSLSEGVYWIHRGISSSQAENSISHWYGKQQIGRGIHLLGLRFQGRTNWDGFHCQTLLVSVGVSVCVFFTQLLKHMTSCRLGFSTYVFSFSVWIFVLIMAAIHQTGFFSLCKQEGLKISDESASGRIWEPACRWLRAPSLTGSPPFRRFLRLKIDRTMYIVRALD